MPSIQEPVIEFEAAKVVVEALVLGRDPVSGEALPPESICLQPATLRALFTALGSLDRSVRAERRAKERPGRAGRPWTPEEDQKLSALFAEERSVPDMASEHERSTTAIRLRLERLGLVELDPSAP